MNTKFVAPKIVRASHDFDCVPMASTVSPKPVKTKSLDLYSGHKIKIDKSRKIPKNILLDNFPK